MKKLLRFSLLAAVCAVLLPVFAAGWSDVPEDAWYAADVDYVTARRIMDGSGGAFRSEAPATRAEIADALWRAAGMPAALKRAAFPDVSAEEPYAPAADWAAEAGVIGGYADGRFGGGDSVTREQFAAMVWRAAGSASSKRAVNFADAADISPYAQTAVAWARENALLGGVGGNRFEPRGSVSRAQAAAVLARRLRSNGTEPPPLTGCVICLDPGHCVTPLAGKGYRELVSPLSTETKAVYTTGTQGAHMTEEKLNLTVGLKLRDRLEALGATVLMTREVSEITITGIERCEISNRARADVAVRIHADGNNDRSVHGVSVMTPTGDLLGTPSIKDESVRLGRLMVDAVAAETGAKNRGIMPRYDLTGFNFSEVPSVLIEMGFMTNREEDALLETDAYQDKIVEGMVKSLLAWYGA